MTDAEILEIARQQTSSDAVAMAGDTFLRIGRAVANAAAQSPAGEPAAWLIEANHLAHKTGYGKRWVTFDKPHPRTEWDVTALYAAGAQPLPGQGTAPAQSPTQNEWLAEMFGPGDGAHPLPSGVAAMDDEQAWTLYILAQELTPFKCYGNREFGIAFVKNIIANVENV